MTSSRLHRGASRPGLPWRDADLPGNSAKGLQWKSVPGVRPRCAMAFPQSKPSRVQPPVRTLLCPSARRGFGWLAAWTKLAVAQPKRVEHEVFVRALCKIDPVVHDARSLTRQFFGIMHRHPPGEFERWLNRPLAQPIDSLRSTGNEKLCAQPAADLPAVRAAFQLPLEPWPNRGTRRPA